MESQPGSPGLDEEQQQPAATAAAGSTDRAPKRASRKWTEQEQAALLEAVGMQLAGIGRVAGHINWAEVARSLNTACSGGRSGAGVHAQGELRPL